MNERSLLVLGYEVILRLHPSLSVFLWVTVLGGFGREGSMVGAASALGLLLAEPLPG